VKLGALADNGGKTQTHALLLGSPAINFIPAVSCPTLPTDQRGVTRPQNTNCDAGTYELWRLLIEVASPTDLRVSWATAAAGCVYNVYEETSPYFTPTDITYANQSSGTMYPKLGNVATNYFYITEAVCGAQVTAISNEVGEFDFAIVPGG
jgi:hypothetical protein